MHRFAGILLALLTLTGCAARAPRPSPVPPAQLDASLKPDVEHPVVAAAGIERSSGRYDVVAVVRIAAGWHIYPLGAWAGPEIPTSLSGTLPLGARWTGPWRVERSGDGATYEGTVRFIRPMEIVQDAPGEVTVPLKLTYQACDAFSCRPPVTLALSASTQTSTQIPSR